MSFQVASRALNINKQYTTLKLIGGNDCLPDRKCLVPDLDVEGGARIKKSLCLEGDFTVGGDSVFEQDAIFLGNVEFMNIDLGNIGIPADIEVDTILPLTGNTVTIDGVVIEDGNLTANAITSNVITASTVCITEDLQVDNIIPKTGGFGVTIEGVLLQDGNLVADMISANSITVNTVITVDTVCAGTSVQTSLLESKTGDTISFSGNLVPTMDQVFNIGSLNRKVDTLFTQDAVVCGNLTVIGNTVEQVQMQIISNIVEANTVIANVVCVNEDLLTDFILEKTPNAGVMIEGVLVMDSDVTALNVNADDVCTTNAKADFITSNVVCVNEELITDTIVPKTPGGNVTVDTNLDMMCKVISNVEVLQVHFMDGKSPINFRDNINITQGHEITFVEGLEIGSLSTTTGSSFNSVAVGKGADATGLDATALGFNATANVDYGIAIGANAIVYDPYDIQLGEAVDSGTGAQLFFRGQKVSDEAWNDGRRIMACIGATGDIDLAGDCGMLGNLNMNGFDVGNIGELGVANIDMDFAVANVVCVNEELLVQTVIAKVDDIFVGSNVIPTIDREFDLGSLTRKFNTIVAQDIVVCGNILGNGAVQIPIVGNAELLEANTIIADTITANTVCVNDLLKADVIESVTANGNVTIEGVTIMDGTVTANTVCVTDLLKVDDITSNTVTADVITSNVAMITTIESNTIISDTVTSNTVVSDVVCVNDLLKTDVIESATANGNVTIEGVTIMDGTIMSNTVVADTVCVNDLLKTDVIESVTANGNVTIEGVTIMDGTIMSNTVVSDVVCVDDLLKTDVIESVTANGNVTIEGVTIMDGTIMSNTVVADTVCVNDLLKADVIESATANGNVTIEGVTIMDGTVTANTVCVTDLLKVDDFTSNTVTADVITSNVAMITTIESNTIISDTVTSNAVVSDVVCVNDLLKADVIESAMANGNVTIEGVTIMDGTITSNTIVSDVVCVNDLLKADVIESATANGNVTIEGVTIMDGTITANTVCITDALKVDGVQEVDEIIANSIITELFSANVAIIETIESEDIISDMVTANLVTVDVVCVNDMLKVDVIESATANGNVIIEGVVIEDGNIEADDISANTITSEVIIGDTVCVDDLLKVDVIESTTMNGNVLIEGVTIMDGNLDANSITSEIVCVAGELFVDMISEKTGGLGVTIEDVVLMDSNVDADSVIAGTVIADDVCVNVELRTDAISAKTGGGGGVVINDDLDLMCNDVSNVEVIEANTLQSKSGPIDILSDVTLSAGMTLSTDVLDASTASEITVGDDLVPDVTVMYSLGSPTLRWECLFAETIDLIGDATILGNLVVAGNTTMINTTMTTIVDNKIVLNSGEMGDGVTLEAAGIIIDRGTAMEGNYQVCFDETRDCLAVGFGNVIANLQCVAEREDIMTDMGVTYWSNTNKRIETETGFTYNDSTDTLSVPTVCVGVELQTDRIEGKIGTIAIGNSTVYDSGTDITVDVVNTNEIGARSGSTITVTDNLDMSCMNVSNVEVFECNTIQSKSGSISISSDLDMMCATIGNIASIEVDEIMEKTIGSGVTIDGVDFLDGNIEANDIIGNTITVDSACVNNDIQVNVIAAKIDEIGFSANLIPTVDQLFDIGSLSHKVNQVFVQDLVVCGNISGNGAIQLPVMGNTDMIVANTVTADMVTANTVCVNEELLVDFISEKTFGAGVDIEDVEFRDGNLEANFVTANTIISESATIDTACINQSIQVNIISSKIDTISFAANLIPTIDRQFEIGSLTRKVNRVVAQDIVVCGNISGNGTIQLPVTGNVDTIDANLVIANVVCVNDDLQTDMISEKTTGSGVMVDGVLLIDGDIMADDVVAETLTANITTANTIVANVACVEGLQVDNISAKSATIVIGNDIDMGCFNISNAEVVEANSFQSKTGMMMMSANLDLMCGMISNVALLEVDQIVEKTIGNGVSVDGVILADSNVAADTVTAKNIFADDVTANVVCVNVELQTDAIVPKSGDIIDIAANVDMMCQNLGNIEGLVINAVTAKSGDIDALSNITISSGFLLSTDTLNSTAAAEITVRNDLVPDITETHSLGSPALRWECVFADTLDLSGDALILGNLSVLGNTTIIDTETVVVEDNKIVLNSGETGPGVSVGASGIIIDRGTAMEGNYQVCFDETRDCLAVGFGNVIANLQCVTEREDIMTDMGVTYWNDTDKRIETETGFTYNDSTDTLSVPSVCVGVELQTDRIEGKIGTISVGNSTIYESGTNITVDTLNTDEICARSGSTITVTANVDVGCFNLSNVEVLEANSIISKSGSVALGGALDLMCSNISNVDVLFADTISPKSVPDDVTVNRMRLISLEGVGSGVGNVTLLRSDNSQICIPEDEVWCLSVDVAGREVGSGNIYCERQYVSAWNDAGTVEIAKLSSISQYGRGSLSNDFATITGNADCIDIVVSTMSTAMTNWTAGVVVTSVV